MPKLPWKPWHEVVKLREDLRNDELSMNSFAADLYEVLMQRRKHTTYEDPEQFFSLTYPTYNLRQLVRDVVLRLAGKNDKAVRQLELTYGGGKTHTLITLYHLVNNPETLPDLPAVAEFENEIGQKSVKSIVAGLCFDKLDVEKGMNVKGPAGEVRMLKQPWSVLAFQLAGDEGLKLLNAEGKAEERETAPAENLLIELLEIPAKKKLGVLILIDEVLMYAREKAGNNNEWRGRLLNFFQYLTQAATKVNRCCIVASLLASDPDKSDSFGRKLISEIYDVFQRQREAAVEPVVKQDVAEVLRRRFFTPASLKNHDEFRQHVVGALKGIGSIDEQTSNQGQQSEARFLESYPFHPDLTEVLYGKWTSLDRFQRTRGVLRTFALALREAEKWDCNPLITATVFLNSTDKNGLSDALRELVTVADTEEWEGKKQAWTAILDGELSQARTIQTESVGLKYREIEQAVIATFLHSQPIGQTAQTRDLMILLGATRPDKIELEKGLIKWAHSSYWLDDVYAGTENRIPTTWRLGNRPNLVQMHSNALRGISDDLVRGELINEIGKTKSLTGSASSFGVKVHTLPQRPRDIEDDGAFHYAVLGMSAASESGKPSAEACRYLEDTTDTEKPRVYRNALILLVPSKDGIEVALARVRDRLAWEVVREDINKQQKDGNVDPARSQTMQINIDKAKGRIPDAIKQAYCIVVTVSEQNENQAFKINVGDDDSHFMVIKNDKRARIRDTAVTPEALLPDGPYNLWRNGETSRRVKDLSGAFAQLPHLPKMLQAKAILETLANGCKEFSFVLRLTRPDGSVRTWWGSKPDENAMVDPALELVLPESAILNELPVELMTPGVLPGLWTSDSVLFADLLKYFEGQRQQPIERNGIADCITIPEVPREICENAAITAVEAGKLWLQSGPASLFFENVPAGILVEKTILAKPPEPVSVIEILPENMPQTWKDETTNAMSIATGLSLKAGKTLPWKIILNVINDALQARFIKVTGDSATWPCDFASAQYAQFSTSADTNSIDTALREPVSTYLYAQSDLEPGQIQDLGDIIPKLLEIKAKSKVPIKFIMKIQVGDGEQKPESSVVEKINVLLKDIKDDFGLR